MEYRNIINTKHAALLLIFLFPIFSAIVKHAGTGIFSLLMLAGLIWGWKSYQLLNDSEKKVIWGFLLFFAIIVLSLINTTDYSMAGRKFERYLRILGIIPIYYLLVRLNVDIYKTLKISLVVSAAVLLSFGLYEITVLNKPFMEGPYYNTLFGYVSVLNAFMLIAVILTSKIRKVDYVFYIVAVVILFNCAVSSTSRASWLGGIAIVLFLLSFFIFHQKVKVTLSKAVISMLVLFTFIAFNAERISEGINAGVQDVETFDANEVSRTSLGIRLSLWKDSITLFLDSPIIGTGVGDFDTDRNKMIAAGLTSATPSYGHAHNQYLNSLATTGLLGLIGLLVGIFILPFWYFWKSYQSSPDEKIKYFSLVGMIVVIGFAFFGVGEVWLARNPTTNVYAFFIAISLAGITNSRKKLNNEN